MQFKGRYKMTNRIGQTQEFSFQFPLPGLAQKLSGMNITVDKIPYKGDTNLADGLQWSAVLKPGESKTIVVNYSARGTNRFSYGASSTQIGNFMAKLETDYTN